MGKEERSYSFGGKIGVDTVRVDSITSAVDGERAKVVGDFQKITGKKGKKNNANSTAAGETDSPRVVTRFQVNCLQLCLLGAENVSCL